MKRRATCSLPAILAGALWLCGALGLTAAPVEPRNPEDRANRFAPIDANPDISDIEAQTRCRDFVKAVQIRRMIEVSNPITGRDETRGRPLEWAERVDLALSFPTARPMSESDYIDRYLEAFGPELTGQPFLNKPIYLRDLAYCQPAFKSYGDRPE